VLTGGGRYGAWSDGLKEWIGGEHTGYGEGIYLVEGLRGSQAGMYFYDTTEIV